MYPPLDADEMIEEIRKDNRYKVRRPGRIGEVDTHGHMWYCYDEAKCGTIRFTNKDHRSFDSHASMLQHLKNSHPMEIIAIERREEERWRKILNGE
jgi:hypothetical protein